MLNKVTVTATVTATSLFFKAVAARELSYFFPRVTVTKLLLESKSTLVTVLNNLGKEVDLQNHIKAISSNFVGFNIFLLKAKHIKGFRLKTIKPSSGYYKKNYTSC